MERHQEEQRDALVEVRVEKDCLEAAHRPEGSPAHRRGRLNCAVASAIVMGLVIVALVAGFILHFFLFTKAPYSQDSSAPNAQEAFSVTCEGIKRDEKGRFVIFAVNKTADYFIYGEVKNANSEDLTLTQTRNGDRRTIPKRSNCERDHIFLEKVRLSSGTRIIIDFMLNEPDSCHFLFYKL